MQQYRAFIVGSEKLNAKREGSPGMGMGLTLIQTLLKAFNASLSIEDKIKGNPSKGTNFIIVFPKFL
jgi:K+-sensing histidine kinase KdpD